MGFYIRRSISVGPIRFNFSKSGIGVSAGIPGFRVGTGPRGNYVHMGRGGLYYRQSLNFNKSSSTTNAQPIIPEPEDHLEEIQSGCVTQMVDSSSSQLLQEINAKQKKIRLFPVALIGSILLWIALMNQGVSPFLTLIALAVIPFIAYQRDQFAKSVVLFYDFDQTMEGAYQLVHDWADQLMSCSRTWNLEARGDVSDPKYHAGAGELVKRKAITIKKGRPPFFKTNISTIIIPVGRETMYFFPDRVLVFGERGVGAIGYDDLQLHIADRSFIEDEAVPRDAKVIDYTWRYVNKKGGPDRRFSNNPELPICKYEELSLTSPSGLNKILYLSRTGVSEGFKKSLKYLADVLKISTN